MVTSPDIPENGREDGGGGEPRSPDKPKATSPIITVRYGHMNHLGEFTCPANMKFACGTKVVVKTPRGIEVGERVALSCPGNENAVRREQVQEYIRHSGPEYCQPHSGRILREATLDDLHENDHLRAGTVEKTALCQATANRLRIPLKVVECEHLLGGERIVFYFLAEGRVDFRALVKEMAVEYQTRIEMRQVGVRDEARLLADYETCGRECCCRMFLKTLRPVSMKMAKMQKATLDPSKVSGRCGRLKCCLRYEHVAYEELDDRLPRIGARVRTAHGDGVVVARQILTQLLQLQVDGGTPVSVAMEDILGAGGEDTQDTRSAASAGAPTSESGKHRQKPVAKPADVDATRAPSAETETVGDEPAGAGSEGAKPTRRRKRRRRKRRTNGPKDSGGSDGTPKTE